VSWVFCANRRVCCWPSALSNCEQPEAAATIADFSALGRIGLPDAFPHKYGLQEELFEVYGLALQHPDRFPEFFDRAIHDWIAYLEPSPRREGHTRADARAIATVLLAGYRGFLLDLCATHDRRRIARAVDLWITALDGIPSPKELSDARRH